MTSENGVNSVNSARGVAAPSGLAVFVSVFLPFALGHFLSSLLRNVNATLAPQLVAALALTPAALGLLTSAFFCAFALVQLPVGIALDRWGPARVQLPLLLLAAIGALAFAGGRDLPELVAARALMGLGVGACFMAAVKAISSAVAPARLPSVHGYLIAVGGLGAASATLPVRLLLHYTDWRGLFLWLALAAAVTALLIRLLAPAPVLLVTAVAPPPPSPPPSLLLPPPQSSSPPPSPSPSRPERPASALAPMAEILRHPSFREAASLVLVPHAVFFGMQGLWLSRWLGDVGGYSEATVAYLLYLGMAAIMFGAIAVGMITEWAGRRGVAPIRVAAAGVALFIAVQLALVCNWVPSLPTLSVLFTLVGTVTGIEYAIVAQGLPGHLTGRAATCLNLLIFLGAFLVQAGFGLLLGCWRPNPLMQYPAPAYQCGLLLLVLLQLPGLFCFVRRRWKGAHASGRIGRESGQPSASPQP